MRHSGKIYGGQWKLSANDSFKILAAGFFLTTLGAASSQAQPQQTSMARADVPAKAAASIPPAHPAPASAVEAPRFNPRAERRIVISLRERKLALLEDGRVVKVYRIAVGTPGTPSPVGKFKILNRVKEPTWYGGSISPGLVVPPGPQNPLGTRWLGLSLRGYGIHGTNAPNSIGKRASHGCIRMRKADIEELFELVRAGDAVELYASPTAELAKIFGTPGPPAAGPAPAALAPIPVVAATLPVMR